MLEKLRPYRWWILGLALLAVTGGGAAIAFASLRQGDPRWSKKLLGKSGLKTIGSSGCLLTAMTMAHNAFYKAGLTPDVVNDRVINAFQGPDLIQPLAAQTLGMFTPGVTKLTGADYATLAKVAADTLAKGGLAMAHVTYNGDLKGDHFILVTQRSGGGFSALDPAGGKISLDPLLQGKGGLGNYVTVAVRPYFRVA